MINTKEFKNKLLNALPRSSNDAEYKFKYFYNGRLIGTNDHEHFELIGCVKLNTVYAIEDSEARFNVIKKNVFKALDERLEALIS